VPDKRWCKIHNTEENTIPPGFNLEAVRKDFPILDSVINGKKLIYLDNAATTHKPLAVINAMSDFMTKSNGTVRRGVYDLSLRSTKAFDEVRTLVQKFINAEHAEEIIFTRGTTESINLVASSFGEVFIEAGDRILISAMEHHANIVPWQLVAARKRAELLVIPMKENGELDLEAYTNLIRDPKLKILALTHTSNALGTVNPIKQMIALAHEFGVPVLIDGAQAIQHQSIDMQDLDADFYAFSGHKLYGPTGVGVLYGKSKYLNQMPPYHGGGEMIERVTFARTTFAQLPFKFEAGTPPIVEVIGLGEAIKYITAIGLEKIQAYEHSLHRYTEAKAQQIPGLRIIGTATHKASIMSFIHESAESFDLGTLLNEHGVAIRVGHHCAQPVMDSFGISSTARVSIAFYNTKNDIDRFFTALEQVLKIFV
jgi:cysteine desulfurase/selenocysteine lyase